MFLFLTLKTYFTHFSTVSMADFEHVNISAAYMDFWKNILYFFLFYVVTSSAPTIRCSFFKILCQFSFGNWLSLMSPWKLFSEYCVLNYSYHWSDFFIFEVNSFNFQFFFLPLIWKKINWRKGALTWQFFFLKLTQVLFHCNLQVKKLVQKL